MPTNYTGVPTATQAPSAAPGPGVLPEFALPADGDNDNAATWAQSLKTAADFIAYQADPFAITGSWAQRTARWRNARLQEKFRIDHMGYPGGDIQGLEETWRGLDSQVGTGLGVIFSATRQRYVVNVNSSGSGFASVHAPDATHLTRYLNLGLGTGGTDFTNVVGDNAFAFATSQGLAMEGTITTDTQINQFTATWGIGNVGTPGWDGPTAGFTGALFVKVDGDTQIYCQTGDGTAVSTRTGTGFTMPNSGSFKYRVEYLGSGVADDSVTAVRFYLNGGAPTTILTNMPSVAAFPFAGPIFSLARTFGSAARTLGIGPYRLFSNT